MARPMKGEPGYKESVVKWRKTTLERFNGDKKAMSDFFRTIGRKGGINGRGVGYTGGFASHKVGEDGMTGYERARIVGSRGGKRSKRGPAKAKEDGRD